mmetsp:Transcript_59704/g.135098  ORF Transcript_59704/g.135098 Transcript_59704/m.135098 type:complete len:209 (-) Transcript_59704:505-1131(-)
MVKVLWWRWALRERGLCSCIFLVLCTHFPHVYSLDSKVLDDVRDHPRHHRDPGLPAAAHGPRRDLLGVLLLAEPCERAVPRPCLDREARSSLGAKAPKGRPLLSRRRARDHRQRMVRRFGELGPLPPKLGVGRPRELAGPRPRRGRPHPMGAPARTTRRRDLALRAPNRPCNVSVDFGGLSDDRRGRAERLHERSRRGRGRAATLGGG